MTLSTYSSYLIVTRDLNTSLNRVSSQAQIKRENEYYEANIGNVKSVDDFMSNYRLYSYAMKAYGLDDMTYAKAFMKKILDSDLTDSDSFANKLTDKRYQEFAAAFNFSGGTKVAQSSGQEKTVTDAYSALTSAEEKTINTETAYYDKYVDKITTVDGLVNNSRLITYALKATGIYSSYYSKDKLKQLLTSDMSDSSSYANVEYVQKRATLVSQSDDMKTVVTAIDNRTSLIAANASINTQLNDSNPTLTDEERQELEHTRTANQTSLASIESSLQDSVGTTDTTELATIRSSYKTQMTENTRLIGLIDGALDLKSRFSFNTDGTLVNATAQTADQKAAMESDYLQNVSTGPSYTLYASNKAHYEEVIANATSVDDIVNDARAVEYIRVAYGFSSYTSASTIRSMMLADPTDSGSSAATKGFQDFPRYFNFNSDGSVKDGMKAQSDSDITFTNSKGASVTVNPLTDIASRYKENFLTSYEDDVDVAIDNYEKRIDAVTSIDDLFETNTDYWKENATSDSDYITYYQQPELWKMALESFGLDSSTFSETKVRRILTSDLNDKNSYAYSLKSDAVLNFAKAFNFDSSGKTEAPLQAQNENVVNDLTTAYKSHMTRFLSTAETKTATTKADTEIAYYAEQMQSITTVDQLLSDSRLVNVMLKSRGIDPDSVTTADLKKMFKSDLSDPKSFVNQQDNKDFAELVASFNFDSDGNLTDSKSVLGNVQQRGDVLETVNRYVRQALEEQQGDSSEGVRLSLYFQRMAPEITSAYSFLNDDALSEFFTTTFSLSSYFSSMDVDKQKAMVEKLVDLDKLSDPKYVASLVQRYAALYDSANNSASSPALLQLKS